MPQKLNEYREKRDFLKTTEPPGEAAQPEAQLRFVVQHHIASRDHFDLRLEWDGVLLSWAVPKGPSYNPHDKRLAVEVEAHPLEYRNFEGIIPKGEYGGGTVMLWDEGIWAPYGDVNAGLLEGSLKFVLEGERLKGKWALVRMKPKAGEDEKNWLLLKEKDTYANAEDSGVAHFTTSIRTGRSMEKIATDEQEKASVNPFDSADVVLAKLVSSIPEGEDWFFELKYDGYRILAFVDAQGVRLMSRNGNDYSHRFGGIETALSSWASGRAMVLDGEMVIVDAQGRTDFQALQRHLKDPQGNSPTYIIFDVLALDGRDLRSQPLRERKQKLQKLLQGAPHALYYSRHIEGNGAQSLAAACEAGLEGIVGKRADSPYNAGRSGDWVKLKCAQSQEFVIVGYTHSSKRAQGISALLLGVYEDEKLVYAGRTGTGFNTKERQMLEAEFSGLIRSEPPFSPIPKPRADEKVYWLEPKLVAQVQFAQWTEDNRLRQASFKGLRTDKPPKDVKREQTQSAQSAQTEELPEEAVSEEREKSMAQNGENVTLQGITITNPQKLLFQDPDITKLNVAQYYAQVAERMLPYVRRRILSIVRCPKGIDQSCFFKKHPGPESKGVVTTPVTNSEGETDDYFYIDDEEGLIYEAQMGTVEFHTWNSRVDTLETPDMLVFDLDPDEGMALEKVRQGVKDIREILSELSLSAYLKTSGGKGYHVVVPLKPTVTWEAFYDFAKRVAQVMEQKWPDRYTSNVRKAAREDKIFIDWIRNGRGATSIAPYSLRARQGAKVSMPILWEELDTLAPDGVDIAEALKRLTEPDPWEGFWQRNQQLK